VIPGFLNDHLGRLLERPGPVRPLVAIAGPVASGKTTLAHAIARAHGTEALSTDEYLPDYAVIPRMERDEPRHADLERLAADLASLREGRETRVPVWSFFENRRVDERAMTPGRVVVVEGLFALHPVLKDLIDLGVFVDGPFEYRRERFVGRSAEGERGFSVEEADAHFRDIAEPTLWRHAPSYYPQAAYRLVHDGAGGFREQGPVSAR
jgi:uridine kinase